MFFIVLSFAVVGCNTIKKSNSGALEDNIELEGADTGGDPELKQDKGAKAAAFIAEPISAELMERFPHLLGFGGHVLIGNQNVQLVLQGVLPPRSYNQSWQPSILAFFELRRTVWQKISSAGSIDLQTQHAGLFYYATNVDIFVNRKAEQAMITYTYSNDNKFADKRMVRFLIDPAQALVNITLSAAAGNPWLMRWRRPTTGDLLVNSTPQDSSAIGVAVHYADQDIVGIITYGTQKTKFEADDLVIESKVSAGLKDQTFDITIGRQATNGLWLRAAALKQCFANPSVQKVIELKAIALEKHEFLEQCILLQKKAKLAVVLDEERGDAAKVSRRLVFKDQKGRDLFYTYGFPGDVLNFEFLYNDKISFVELAPGEARSKLLTLANDGENFNPVKLPARPHALPKDTITATNSQNLGIDVPRLVVRDPDQQITLAILPSNADLEKKWNDIRPQNPDELLAQFAKFSKTHAADRVLELGCPSEGMSPAEYSKLVEKLRPQALELYDCFSARGAPEFAAAFATAAKDSPKPIYLTATKASASDGGVRYIAYASADGTAASDKDLQGFVAGKYSIASPALIRVEALSVVGKPTAQKRTLKLTAALRTIGSELPKALAIFTENGKVSEEILKSHGKSGAEEAVSINVSIPMRDRWIRVEAKDGAKVLGSSNFIQLNNL